MTMRNLLLAVLMIVAFGSHTQAAAFTPDQRQEMEAIIKDYLLRHPELLREMSDLLQNREKLAEEEQRKSSLAQRADQVFRDKGDFVAGNPKGNVTMVEFFDYNCGWCKKGLPEVLSLLESDKELRFVLKEFPIFGEDSDYAAKAAIAAGSQGKYWQLHVAMLGYEGKITKSIVDELAAAQGLDMEKLTKDMDSPGTADILSRNRELASALAINGTPAFVIDDKLVPGYLPKDELAASINETREKGCSLC
jgi:protein-disulfide isomerase